MAYTYDSLFAVDPNSPSNIARNASILLFDPNDPAKTPVTLTDVTDAPVSNPVQVNQHGFGPAIKHPTLDRLAWEGAGMSGVFTSYEGMKEEAVAARQAAQVASAAAQDSAALAQAPTDAQVDSGILRADIPSHVASAVPPLVAEQVPPLVADALADDPTVASAAAALAQQDAGLVRGTDARLPQNVGTIPGYKEVTVTTGGFVLSAVLDDGTVYNFFDTANPARTADSVTVPGYRNIVFDKTKTFVLEADKEDGSKYFHKLSAAILDVPETAITRPAAVASFGDSMTGDAGGTGTTTGAYIGTVLGIPAFQGGVPGQTTTEASFRAGGIELWGSVTGGTIPTSGTVPVVMNVPAARWASASAWTFAVSAVLEDGTEVPGSLVKAVGNTWTFQATFLTASKAAPREVKFVADEGKTYASRGIIFRAGRNNPDTDIDIIVRDYKAVRERVYATQARPRFLALPLYNPSDAPTGSVIYNQYKSINAALEEECGPDFYDLRRWLIKYGLSAAGITPTAQDEADIAQDIVPTSLRHNGGADTTHLNNAGRIAEATQIAHVIRSKGWFTS